MYIIMCIFLSLSKPLRLLGNITFNTVNCNSVLRVTCPCCFVCLCVFCDSFLCSISFLLLSGSPSYILNSVL